MRFKKFENTDIDGNLNLKVSMPNTDRLIFSCPETQNNFRANKTTSRSKINKGSSYLKFHNICYKMQKMLY